MDVEEIKEAVKEAVTEEFGQRLETLETDVASLKAASEESETKPNEEGEGANKEEGDNKETEGANKEVDESAGKSEDDGNDDLSTLDAKVDELANAVKSLTGGRQSLGDEEDGVEPATKSKRTRDGFGRKVRS